jgi:hypothetical protein
MGDSRFARCLQGGGVYVSSGTVTISSCTISGNTAADIVRAHIEKLPSPDGKIADGPASTQRLQNCGQRSGPLQSVRVAETFKVSHRPHGRLTFCLLLAGRWRLCLFWNSGHRIVHHKWELC